jgi:hypothetical protein
MMQLEDYILCIFNIDRLLIWLYLTVQTLTERMMTSFTKTIAIPHLRKLHYTTALVRRQVEGRDGEEFTCGTVDQLEDQGTAGDDARATGKEISVTHGREPWLWKHLGPYSLSISE